MSTPVPSQRFAQGHTPQSRANFLSLPLAAGADHAARQVEVALRALPALPRTGASLAVDDAKRVVNLVAHLPLPLALLPSALRVRWAILKESLSTGTVCRPIESLSEEEVTQIKQKLAGDLHDIPDLPPLSTAMGPPRHFDYGATIKRVRIATMIELSTIPLYLYAMYSVKPEGEGLRIRALVRTILEQEMLHLALSGNLLSAIGGSVDLYDSRVIPAYPAQLLCSDIPANLEPLSRISLGRFMEIEAPVDASHRASEADRNVLASQYASIGQLYEDLILSIRGLTDDQFTNSLNRQFMGRDFFPDLLFPILDQASALKALSTIIEQGEGNLSVENSHYDIFSQLYSGPDWEVYKVPLNPKTEDYIKNAYIYRLSLSFDAAYCYLLQTIESVWKTENASDQRILFGNIHKLMSNVITPLANILVQQKWRDGVAAPCFDYYPIFGLVAKDPLDPVQLHGALIMEVSAAADAAPTTNNVAAAIQIAAGRAADAIQAAAQAAIAAAPGTSIAQDVADSAQAVERDANELRNISPSNAAAKIVALADQISKAAAKVAADALSAARYASDDNAKAARDAANAGVEAREAGEAAAEIVCRFNEKAELLRLKAYIESIPPPYH